MAGRKGKCKGCGGAIQIPTPRGGAAAPHASSAPRDELVTPRGVFDDDDDEDDEAEAELLPEAAVPVRREVAPSRTKGSRAGASTVTAKGIVIAVGWTVLGVTCLALALGLVEIAVIALKQAGPGVLLERPSLLFYLVIVGLATWGAGLGFGKAAARMLPQASEGPLRAFAFGGVALLALIDLGLSASRDITTPTPLFGAMINARSGGGGPSRTYTMSASEAEAKMAEGVKGLGSDDPEVREKAIQTLGDAGMNGPPASASRRGAVRKRILGLLGTTDSNDEKFSLLMALGIFGDKQRDLSLIQGYLNDPAEKVASAARMAEGKLSGGF